MTPFQLHHTQLRYTKPHSILCTAVRFHARHSTSLAFRICIYPITMPFNQWKNAGFCLRVFQSAELYRRCPGRNKSTTGANLAVSTLGSRQGGYATGQVQCRYNVQFSRHTTTATTGQRQQHQQQPETRVWVWNTSTPLIHLRRSYIACCWLAAPTIALSLNVLMQNSLCQI